MAWIDTEGAARLRDVTIPVCLAPGASLTPDVRGLARADIALDGGRIGAIAPAAPTPLQAGDIVCDGGMVWPCFADLHTHLDKGHIWPRRANPDGTFMGALSNVGADREAHWSARDVSARMEFALRCAYAHGTSAIRTHLDSIPPQPAISFPVFAEMRERWAGQIALQSVALFSIDRALAPDELDTIARTAAEHGGILGPVSFPMDGLDDALDRAFEAAARHELDLDLHVDETQDPESRTLLSVAEATIRHGYQGRVTAGHCTSLALQDDAMRARIIARVAEAEMAVVSLPLCNMYLQDRHRQGWDGETFDAETGVETPTRTPRWRGVTAVHELKGAGIPVAFASDNTRDPFYAYGDLDMVEVHREATRIAHLDHPVGDWPRAFTTTPADVMGLSDVGRIAAGGPADLVLFRARDWSELLSRPQSDRAVLRAGRPIDTALPDYRELDALLARQQETAS
ncbi:MAG: cytosine deaminase [Pseudomonadota bacterium]